MQRQIHYLQELLKYTGGTASGAPAVKNANVALLAIGLPNASVISGVRYALYHEANASWPELIVICAVFESNPCAVIPLTLADSYTTTYTDHK